MTESTRPQLSQQLVDVAGLLLLAIGVFALVLAGKEIANSDSLAHYRWLTQFSNALAEGTWYPLWRPKQLLGLGELSYSAYLLYFYIGSFLVFIGFDHYSAMKTMAIAANFLGGLIIYAHFGTRFGRGVALTGAALWQLSPFALFLFSHTGALPWHFSLFLALELICLTLLPGAKPSGVRIALVAAALGLAHFLVAFMTLLCLGLTLLVRAVAERTPISSVLRQWVLPAALGAGLLGFHYVPAVAAQRLLNSEAPEILIYMHWKNSFLFPSFSTVLWGMRWFAAQWILPASALAGVVACAVLLWHQRTGAHRSTLLALTTFAALGLLLGSELALPLYALPTPFQSLQWPYRFNTVAALGIALALPLALLHSAPLPQRAWTRLAVIAAMAFNVLLLLGLQLQFLQRPQETRMTSAAMQGLFRMPGNEFATIGAKWREYAEAGGLAHQCQRARAQCVTKLDKTQHRIWEVALDQPARLVFPLFAFPGWTVRVDGKDTHSSIDADTGLISLTLPSGRHRVEIELTGVPQKRFGLIVSLVSLAGLVLLPTLQRRRAHRAGARS